MVDADDLIRKFKYEDYPQIAVSVDMLTTGFDCREVLHLVMCRRIHSPILYQQIRGRGTRTAPHIDKEKFVIYDFFGNHDYFNDSDTDIFTGPGTGRVSDSGTAPPKPPRDLEVNDLFQPPLSILNAAGLGVELFGERRLKEIIEDMNESVFSQKIA